MEEKTRREDKTRGEEKMVRTGKRQRIQHV
jgi:hypothetical protein